MCDDPWRSKFTPVRAGDQEIDVHALEGLLYHLSIKVLMSQILYSLDNAFEEHFFVNKSPVLEVDHSIVFIPHESVYPMTCLSLRPWMALHSIKPVPELHWICNEGLEIRGTPYQKSGENGWPDEWYDKQKGASHEILESHLPTSYDGFVQRRTVSAFTRRQVLLLLHARNNLTSVEGS